MGRRGVGLRIAAAGVVMLRVSAAMAGDDVGASHPRAEAWVGVSAEPGSIWTYAGMTAPFRGDLWASGAFMRADAGFGRYEQSPSFTGRFVPHVSADVMIGYQTFVHSARFAFAVGPVLIDHDTASRVVAERGLRGGARALGEVYLPLGNRAFLSASADFATPFRTYSALAKVGFRLSDRVWIGPEIGASGDRAGDHLRLGLAAGAAVRNFEINAEAGATFTRGGKNGPYATLELRRRF